MGNLLLTRLDALPRAGERFTAREAVRTVVWRKRAAEKAADDEPCAALTALLLAPATGRAAARTGDRVLKGLCGDRIATVETVNELTIVGRTTALTDSLHHPRE